MCVCVCVCVIARVCVRVSVQLGEGLGEEFFFRVLETHQIFTRVSSYSLVAYMAPLREAQGIGSSFAHQKGHAANNSRHECLHQVIARAGRAPRHYGLLVLRGNLLRAIRTNRFTPTHTKTTRHFYICRARRVFFE